MIKLLICDDETAFHFSVKHSLNEEFEIRSAFSDDQALQSLHQNETHIVILNGQMKMSLTGLNLITKIKDIDSEVTVVIAVAVVDFAVIKEAMKLGATDYITKDSPAESLLHSIRQAADVHKAKRKLRQQNYEALFYHRQFPLIGKSKAIQTLRLSIEAYLKNPSHAMVTGEPESGKTVLARNLRIMSTDGGLSPFVELEPKRLWNSSPEVLLFGYEKGAISGTKQCAPGLCELANEGTLYIHDIMDIPLELQDKLAQVLKGGKSARLGSSKMNMAQFRLVVAALSQDQLEEQVKIGRLSPSLYELIKPIRFHMPPLRERSDDLAELIHFLIDDEMKHTGPCNLDDCLQIFKDYNWPGNVGELKDVLRYLVRMSDGQSIAISDLPPAFRERTKASVRAETSTAVDNEVAMIPNLSTFQTQMAEFEKKLITEEYVNCGGNINQLALRLGVNRAFIITKLKEFNMHISSGS